jgi:two-component system chemotaxis response regulator CheB
MPPIRVLVVDDSVVIRKVLSDVLASDPAVEVAGTASDGRLALAKIGQLKPDLITLDVEMPNMSGLETIKEIRKLHPRLPIIMFSTLTERGASTTLDALAIGASDYVTKPSNTGSLDVTMLRIKEDLLPKIKALCVRGFSDKKPMFPPAQPPQHIAVAERSKAHIEIVAIGTSTGGPNALAEVIPSIPADFPVPIVIVQHMPPLFTRLLAERLDKASAISVREGEPGKKIEPGHAWIAPGDYHMTLERRAAGVHLSMNQAAPENSCRPAVDVLFRSVAATFGANTLAVVLTGMGSDGVLGSQAIRERGGRVYVQDEATSVVWGMPGQTAAAGFADNIYPLRSMALEIDRQVRASRQGSVRQAVRSQVIPDAR